MQDTAAHQTAEAIAASAASKSMYTGAGITLGGWWMGAAIGAAFYIGRELAQAEYRIIYTHYNRKRANAPWWCGFDRRAWAAKDVMDFTLPAIAVLAVAILLEFHLP